MAAGWLAATAAGAVAGALAGGAVGGIVGAMVDAGVPEEDANLYAEGVRRGGSLVTARVDESRLASVEAILERSPCVNVAARRASYTEQGWNRFDETADAYRRSRLPRSATGIG